ncbi:MAG: PBP1A family penicillin-binding protein [Lachnospiraceae bacterium]|nr:PBP1A family penicillin-binding protein [Lachnospiraceae bacterium]
MAEKRKTTKKRSGNRRIVATIVKLLAFVIVVGGLCIGGKVGMTLISMKKEAVELVSTATRDTFRASQTTEVYDTNGELITKLKGEKDVYYLDYEAIPQTVKDAVVAVEDVRFYHHKGIDLKGIMRAMVSLVRNKGEIHEGASTITQQLARGIFLNNEVTWTRKVKEMFVAIELEKVYSKEDILEFYLNNIYYSNGYYGIQAAAQGYFRKDANQLNLSEMAYLSAIPNGPTLYNPYNHPENTLKRRDKILKDMLKINSITQKEYDEAIDTKIKVKKKKVTEPNDYVETYTIRCATRALMRNSGFEFKTVFDNDREREVYQDDYDKAYATAKRTLYTAGYRIYTSIDLDKQEELQAAVNDRMTGFTKKKDGVYVAQAAATCIDNRTGKVVAIVGGRAQDDVEGYTLNRAYQSARQPGSSLKPLLVYAPMLERGYGPGSTVDDTKMSKDDKHHVSNAGSYSGHITLRSAVMKSSNVATMRLYEELTPKTAIKYLEKMGFMHICERDYKYYTTCLGGMTYGATTEEMAAGYATLANGGQYREPTCIKEILSAQGELVVKGEGTTKKIYSKDAASKMTDVLQSVVSGGTGRGAKINNIDTAGKTGTTSDYRDGWFCGYTPYYTTAVWVGRDDHKVIDGLHGNTYPLYIWRQFMGDIHESITADLSFGTTGSGAGEKAVAPVKKTEAKKTEMKKTESVATEAPATEATTQAATEAPSTEAPSDNNDDGGEATE